MVIDAEADEQSYAKAAQQHEPTRKTHTPQATGAKALQIKNIRNALLYSDRVMPTFHNASARLQGEYIISVVKQMVYASAFGTTTRLSKRQNFETALFHFRALSTRFHRRGFHTHYQAYLRLVCKKRWLTRNCTRYTHLSQHICRVRGVKPQRIQPCGQKAFLQTVPNYNSFRAARSLEFLSS